PRTDISTLSLHDALPILTSPPGDQADAATTRLTSWRRGSRRCSRWMTARCCLYAATHLAALLCTCWTKRNVSCTTTLTWIPTGRSEEHTSELQSRENLVC